MGASDYNEIPHLAWLNEHFTSEFIPDKEWVAVSDTGMVAHSPSLDELLETIEYGIAEEVTIVYVCLTKPEPFHDPHEG